MNYFVEPGNEASYRQAVARLTKYARLKLGLSLLELSKKTGVSRSELTKIEKQSKTVSASGWIALCDVLKIPGDSLKYGYIDRLTDKFEVFGSGFDLPSEYVIGANICIRDILPLFRYIEAIDQLDFDHLFSKILGIDPFYMLTVDHKVNHHFVSKLLFAIKSIMGRANEDHDEFVYDLVSFSENQMKDKFLHGRLSDQYDSCSSKEELLKSYIQNRFKYESLYDYNIKSAHIDTLIVEIKPSQYLQNNYDVMDMPFKLYMYDRIEKNIRGMGRYLISDKRIYQLKELQNLIKYSFDETFSFEVTIKPDLHLMGSGSVIQ